MFNSFFFEKLSNRDFEKEIGNSSWEKQKAAHDRVGKWTRGVDIFKKDFLFFPFMQIHTGVLSSFAIPER